MHPLPKQHQHNKYTSNTVILMAAIALLLLRGGTAWARETPFPYHFRHITANDGLPQNTIKAIHRDHNGFMWFGTNNGVCKYDGYNFKTFEHQTMQNNIMNCMAETPDHRLWIGTLAGLYTINLDNEKTETFATLGNGPTPIEILALLADKDGGLWVGTKGQGLFHIKQGRGEPQITHIPFNNSTFRGTKATSLLQTANGTLYIGTDKGITTLDATSGRTAQWLPGNVNAILETGDSFWLGLTDGLVKVDKRTLAPTHYRPNTNDAKSIRYGTVTSLAQDPLGNIYIGSLGGVEVHRPNTDVFEQLPCGKGNGFSLNNEFVNTILCDLDGNVWIGTEKGGINQVNIYQKPFYHLTHRPNEPSLASPTVNSIATKGQQLYIGTAGGGITQYDFVRKTFTQLKHNGQNPQSLPGDFVSSLAFDAQGRLWAGTWGNGIGRMAGNGRFDRPADGNGAIPGPFISSIIRDAEGYMWIATTDGIALFDEKTQAFAAQNTLGHGIGRLENAGCILPDTHGNLWIGTRTSLYRFDKKEILAGRTNATAPGSDLVVETPVISLLEDKDGTVWAGTYGNGVLKLSDKGRIAASYTSQNGLCNNMVYGIQQDGDGNLWLSTDNGLSCFDTEKKTFLNYDEQDGLPGNQFYWNASHKSASGLLFFGGTEGLCYFGTNDFTGHAATPATVITSFKIFNQEVPIGPGKEISQCDTLRLSHRDNIFSLEFSSPNYAAPHKIKYAYKLEGVNRDWVTVGARQRTATYTNLQGGTYRFRVKATDANGRWANTERTVTLLIAPPFWQTLWFRLLMAVTAVGGVVLYGKLRNRRLIAQTQTLEKLVDERTAQVTQQADQLRLANQQRIAFFTNISHEFMTPLTLIISPTAELLKDKELAPPTRATLQTVNQNAKRLHALVAKLLKFRKIESGLQPYAPKPTDVRMLTEQVFQSFGNMAQLRDIDYRLHLDLPDNGAVTDPETVENVLYNLLSNAFKYTPPGKTITLSAHITQTPAPMMCFEVADRGIGIDATETDKIFDGFYRSPNANDQQGTGIGLATVKELLELAGGSISVKSQKGQGSSFTALLPYVPANVAAGAATGTPAHPTHAATPRTPGHLVLIVEDNPDLLTFLSQAMAKHFRVETATNGAEGLEAARRLNPDLILSDVMMPQMDGMQMCRAIKSNLFTSHIPVILLSAKTLIEHQLEGLKTGADDYIPKPFDPDLLKAKINTLIENRHRFKQLYAGTPGTEANGPTVSDLDRAFLDDANRILDQNHHNNAFTIENFASAMNMSYSSLYKKFKGIMDLSPNDFVTLYRLKKATALLQAGALNINEVAFRVGFNDPKYFSRIFKKVYKKTPTEYVADANRK